MSGTQTSGAEDLTPDRLFPAPFSRRMGAFLVDLTLIHTLFGLLMVAAFAGLWLALRQLQLALPSQELVISIASRTVGGWSLLFLGYMTLFTALGGQTPGKMLLRLRVIRLHDPHNPHTMTVPWWLAIWRSLICYASLPFFLLFGLAAIPPGKRALHDYLAFTRVIDLRVGSPSQNEAPGQGPSHAAGANRGAA